MIRTLIALPFRLVALVVAIPTKLSARLLRFSAVAAFRTTRFAVRSSLISFGMGVGLGWFLSTPTGRHATATVLDAVRGGRGAQPGSQEQAPAAATAAPASSSEVDGTADTEADGTAATDTDTAAVDTETEATV